MQQQKFIIKNKAKQAVAEGIEAVESSIKQAGSQTAKSISNQVVGGFLTGSSQSEGSAHDMTREVVADFYESSDPAISEKLAGRRLPKAGEMKPEEQAKYHKLWKELHDQTYYSRLIERKSQEAEHAEEAQVQKEEEKMEELKVDEKKKQDQEIAVTMVTNKTEQFPGVAG